MTNLIVNPTEYSVTDINQNTINVNFTCDKTLTDIKLSMDNGSTYIDKLSMTQTNAVFDIAGKNNNNYNCKLKGFYEEVTPPTYEFDVVNKIYRGSKNTIVDIEGVCTYPNIDYWEVDSPDGWVGVANSFSDGRFKLELPIFLANKTYSNCVMYAKRNKTDEEQEDTIIATAPTKFTLVVEDVVEPPPTNKPVTSVSVDPVSHVFTSNTPKQLTHTILPTDATNKNVTWSSTNTSVATVVNGLVTPNSNGMCQIKVTTQDGNKTAMCSVIVEIEEEVIPPVSGCSFRGVAYVVKAHENGYTALEGLKQYEKYNHQTSLLCLGISCNFDTNIPATAITDSLINTMCDNVESKGLSPVLKCHTVAMNDSGQGNTEQPTNPSLWFSNYKKVVDRIADIAVARGYKEIIISNEMNMVTNISSWKQYFTPIIASVKAKGLKVGCSVNYPEVIEQDGFQYFNEIDFIGLNLYVSLTKDGKQWAKDNPAKLREGFYTPNFSGWGAIRWGDFLRDLGGNSKDIWITELGCIPNTNGLYAPAYWGEGYQRDEEVQKIYMDTLMDILENDTGNKLTGRIKKYILWDGNSDSDYNMVGKQGEVILDKYWLDKTVTPPPFDDGNYFDFENEVVENYGCTSIIDKTNKTIKVSSDYSPGYYGYLIWDTSNIREGRRYRLTCKSSSDKTFVRFKVDDKRVIDQAFKTSYSIEFDGVNTKEKIAELNFGIRNASNIGEISSIFSEIELIDLDGTPPPTPSTDVTYDIVDYKIIVKKDNISESYHANDDIPVNLNGNGGVDGYKLVIKNRRKYYLSLTRGSSPSKITIDGMKPFDYSYIDQDFKSTWSNRGYAVKNNTLKYTIANRIDNDEYGITNDRTINPSVLTEALRVYNCAMPGYMEITQDQNSVNSVSEASFEDNFLGICRLYQGEKFHVHQNIRLLGGFGNSSRFYVAVLVHELGHTTGIWDDSPHYPTVYIYNRDQSNEWLQPSDIACIKDKFPHLTGKTTKIKEPIKTNNDTNIVFNYPHYKDENEMMEKAHKVVDGIYIGINNSSDIKGYIYNWHKFECDDEIIQVKIHESFVLGLLEGEKYRLYLNEFNYLLNPKETILVRSI